jgi:hypothetical protein
MQSVARLLAAGETRVTQLLLAVLQTHEAKPGRADAEFASEADAAVIAELTRHPARLPRRIPAVPERPPRRPSRFDRPGARLGAPGGARDARLLAAAGGKCGALNAPAAGSNRGSVKRERNTGTINSSSYLGGPAGNGEATCKT